MGYITREVKMNRVFMKFGSKTNCLKLLNEGIIHCKPISYFSTSDGTSRQDKHENAYRLICGALTMKKIEGKPVNIPSFPGQLILRKQSLHNLYCLFSLDCDKPFESSKLMIDKRFKKNFGEWFVLIHNNTEFARRLNNAILESGYSVDHKDIHYKPLNDFTGFKDDFTKDISYKWQKEYRFKFETGIDDVIEFKLGDLNDVAVLVSSDEGFIELEIEPPI
jgi:hypothetical protein